MMRRLSVILLLLPVLARASEAVGGADTTGVFVVAQFLQGAVAFLLFGTVVAGIAGSVVLAASFGAQKLWKAVFRKEPPFGEFSVGAVLVALLLGAVGVVVVPAFGTMFAAFGANLPVLTLLVTKLAPLLPGVVCLVVLALYFLRKDARREQYFAAVMVGELVLLVVAVVSMYLPVFDMGEAVAG